MKSKIEYDTELEQKLTSIQDKIRDYSRSVVRQQEKQIIEALPDWEYKLIDFLPNKIAKWWVKIRGYKIIESNEYFSMDLKSLANNWALIKGKKFLTGNHKLYKKFKMTR